MSRIMCLILGLVLGVALMIARGSLQEQMRPLSAHDAVKVVLDIQATAWNKGDLEGFMQGYWQDDQLSFYSGNSIRAGFEETIARYRQTYQANDAEMGQLRFDDLQFESLSPDIVLVKGRWHLTQSKAMPEGLFTLIVKRFPHIGWKIVHDHTSKACAEDKK